MSDYATGTRRAFIQRMRRDFPQCFPGNDSRAEPRDETFAEFMERARNQTPATISDALLARMVPGFATAADGDPDGPPGEGEV